MITTPPSPAFMLSQAVHAAQEAERPVVALESTIITHGMPWPGNLETALAVEDIVRKAGAEPATIAVIDGHLRIGLDSEEIEALARTTDALKLSRADLAFAVSQGRTGSTTVAATMLAAHRAGIRVFATGGIGGVHRGAAESFDISADLDEMARTPVIVVCAGAKALLDIPKTLEVLESRGVPVVTHASDNFPAFWSRRSGLQSPLSLSDAAAIADFQKARDSLGIDGGMLVANPVGEDDEIPREEMEAHIATALGQATEKGVTGKAVTPFLLDALYRLTDGRSLETNIALVRANAKLAAQIAIALT